MESTTTPAPESPYTMEDFKFSWVDYCVFSIMLMFSTAIGIYYGFFEKKKSDIGESDGSDHLRRVSKGLEYLTGGSRDLKPFPVAMSLVASYISGVTVLGTPAEVYFFGTQYLVILLGIACMGVTVAFVYLPVFLQLQISSSYQYLELRFNSAVRTAACVLFIIDELLFLPIVLYVPSLAFNQVTGVGLHLIGSIVCAVCIFYTSVGGLKAVVWTDTLQILLMFFSLMLVIVIGTINIGGVGEIWKRASDGGRLQLWNFDPNPLERHTFWSLVIGGYIYWTAFNSVNQTMVQRYLALPNLRQAQAAMGMFTAGILIFLSFCCFAGVLIYATYYDCDPLSAKMIKAEDQLLPLYVMQTTHYILGIPGLFIAGVFSAALSSLSTVLNSTTAVIITDILEPVCHFKLTGIWKSILARGLVIVLGLISIGCLFIVEHLGSVLQVVYTLGAIAAGTSFGVFSLGILFPWANTKGALTGAIAGASLIGWISIGSQASVASGKLAPEKLPLSVEGCSTVKDEFSVQYFNVSPVMEPLSYSTFSSPTSYPHVSSHVGNAFDFGESGPMFNSWWWFTCEMTLAVEALLKFLLLISSSIILLKK